MDIILYMTYTRKDILKDEFVLDFFNSRPLKIGTKNNYISRIKNYCNFTGKLPKDLILEAEKEQDEGIRSRNRKIKKHLNSFTRYLEEQDYSPVTIKQYISDLKAFYHEYDIEVQKVRVAQYILSGVRDLPTMKEIKKVVRSANTRDKAIVLLHLSSGMTINELSNLTYSNFLEAIEAPEYTKIEQLRDLITSTTIPRWILRRGKTGYEYTTFSSPESTLAIVDYLEERKYECKWLFPSKGNCAKINITSYMGIFQRLNDKNNLGFKENGKSRRFTSHQLRRVFATNLSGAGVDRSKVNYMLGHKEDPTIEAYFKNNPDKIKMDYISGLDSITINKIQVIKFDDPKVKEIQTEVAELKRQLALQKKVINQMERLAKINYGI